jgi:aspartyl/asparaginyl-tRNA synthetase
MVTLGPYRCTDEGQLWYAGNRLHAAGPATSKAVSLDELRRRYRDLTASHWGSLARINSTVFDAAVRYFQELGALFVPLPLTTRMISSPGAVYGRYALNYTTDTVPITLKWFDLEQDVFLSESSQIYLELALTQPGVHQVFSIYNSFRKETADLTHLSEFHHIEYEGNVDAESNVTIAEGCVRAIITSLLADADEAIRVFLTDEQVSGLANVLDRRQLFERSKLLECFDALYRDTGDPRYTEFTLADRFGRWEEVRLTELYGAPLAISEYPLLEVPFYHAAVADSDPPRARNTDFIWAGYAECVGAGERVGSREALEDKARIFNLPREDYAPYLHSRSLDCYRPSAGFGIGWERLVQAILCLPDIRLAGPFPRTDLTLSP